jgi:phage baseplate assembly protein W
MISEVDIEDWEPRIELLNLKENEDGSADCELKLSPVALKYLVNFAFVTALKRTLDEGKLYTPDAPTE